MEPWISVVILAAALFGGLLLGWFVARLRYRREPDRPRRVERPGMRADPARLEQLEGELAIARRQLMRASQTSSGKEDRLHEAEQAVSALRTQLESRDARIRDLEAQLSAQRIAPKRVPPAARGKAAAV